MVKIETIETYIKSFSEMADPFDEKFDSLCLDLIGIFILENEVNELREYVPNKDIPKIIDFLSNYRDNLLM